MTHHNPMLDEMIQVHNSLSITSMRTKDKFDSMMRATVKDLVSYRYTQEEEPIRVTREKKAISWHYEYAQKIGDIFSGMDTSHRMQLTKDKMERDRTRPLRIINYIQKLIDIFPSAHLTHLLRSCLRLSATETIRLYEANKGEAELNDYSGEPTQIDLTSTKTTATRIRARRAG